MQDHINTTFPIAYQDILKATEDSGFSMASDLKTCGLLKTLAASKPNGRFLELGTGTGLSTAWILDGMDKHSTCISVDFDAAFLQIAQRYLAQDARLELVHSDAGEWLQEHQEERFDFIFADTWHGKYLLLDHTLAMLKPGGWYIIDDMLPQPNWPEGHDVKAEKLVVELEARKDVVITKQVWATGLILAVKIDLKV
jgi:predicted O-methyltransferase YrrM